MIHWLAKALLASFFFAVLPNTLALIATLVLLYPWYGEGRGRHGQDEEERDRYLLELARLVELHGAIENRRATGAMDEEDYRRVRDALLRRYPALIEHFTGGQTRLERLERGWSLLRSDGNDLGNPPWRQRPAPFEEPRDTEQVPRPAPKNRPVIEPKPVIIAQETPAAPALTEQAVVTTAVTAVAGPGVVPARPVSPHSGDAVSRGVRRPRDPGIWRQRGARLSRAFREMALPFLWQNIGWFIGAFFLVSGSVFLVRYSQGFFKGLAVFASLAAFSLLFTWAGYQIRKHRAEQALSSNVLLAIGVLLVPPSLAAGTSLILDSGGSLGFAATGAVLLSIVIAVFSVTVRLSSGLIERRLPAAHSRLFIQLAAIQCALPVIGLFRHWAVIGALDSALLGILAFGVVRHGREWIKEIFIDRRMTTYYAVGTLIFAAAVSFSHVHWVSDIMLPRGYPGVFVMAVSLLLLIADVQLKNRIGNSAWVGRLTFVIYGLSVVGALLAWGNSASVPPSASAFTLTIALAAGLYAEMVRRYLSLAPFYLLAASGCALYSMLFLVHLRPQWHFLAGLPPLLLIWRVHVFAGKRQSAALSRVALRVTLALGGLLLAWSLLQSRAGVAAFTSALAGAALVRLVQRKINGAADWTTPVDKAAGYLQNALIVIAFAMAPAIGGLSRVPALSVVLMGLGAAWGFAGGRSLIRAPGKAAVMVDSALLAVAAGTAVSLLAYPGYAPLAVAYLAAALLASLALFLRLPSLLYAAMAAGTLGYGLYKFGYGLSTHKGTVYLVIPLLWLALRVLAMWLAPFNGVSGDGRCVRVFGLDLRRHPGPRAGVLLRPLTHALWALGAVALVRLGAGAVEQGLTATWAMQAIVLALLAVTLAGEHAARWLFSVGFVLLLAFLGVLAGDGAGALFGISPWIAPAVGWACLMLWAASWAAHSRQIRFWPLLGWQTSPAQLQHWVRQHVLLAQLAVAAMVVFFLLESSAPVPLLLGAGLSSALFLAVAGFQQQRASYTYLLLGVLFSAGWATYGRLAHLRLDQLLAAEPFSAVFPWLALAGGLAFVALGGRDPRRSLYAVPMRNGAALLFALGLGATVTLMAQAPGLGGHIVLAFMLLAAAAVPLSHGLTMGPGLRGVGLPTLFSAAFLSLGDGAAPDHLLLSLWGFALWATACFLLPRLNRRWPDWMIAPRVWPVIGLTFALGGLASAIGEDGLRLVPVALFTVYLLALYASVSWAWLHVAVANAVLLLVPVALFEVVAKPLHPGYLAGVLLWANLLLGVFPLIGRRPRLLWWNLGALLAPLRLSITAVLSAGLYYMVMETIDTWHRHSSGGLIDLVPMFLLPLTWVHLLGRAQTRFAAHGAIIAIADLYLALVGHLVGLAVALATLFVLLSLVRFVPGRFKWTVVDRAAAQWLPVSFAAAVAGLALRWGSYGPVDYLAMLAVSAGAFAAGIGAARGWIHVGKLSILVSLHLPWLHWMPALAWPALTPWWALQNMVLVFALDSAPAARLRERLALGDAHGSSNFSMLLAALALLQLALHAVWVLVGGLSSTAGSLGQLAGSAAALLWLGRGLYRARAQGDAMVYLMSLAAALIAGYLRLLWFGAVPMTVWDTAALIAASFLTMSMHRVTGSQALYRVSMALPALALLTMPLQLESLHASVTLLAIGSYYLVSHWRNEARLPLYLGLLAINVGAYLWVPGIAGDLHLLQIYTVPAAITVLAMLHLHALELKPSVRHAARLGALSVLYASAALDLFLKPGIGVFVLALALSLGGVVLGVALQVRAFLYSGTVFLILAVAGQLFMNYPEGNLAKGALLMAGGAGITGAMIWMNIKRDTLLRRLQELRAELEDWE